MRAITLLFCLLITVQPVLGAGRWRKVWKASLIVLAASSAGDAASSWGGPEANPLLANSRGRFGTRGLTIKATIAGAAVLSQAVMVRCQPQAAPYAATGNIVIAGLFNWAVVHNMRIRQEATARRKP